MMKEEARVKEKRECVGMEGMASDEQCVISKSHDRERIFLVWPYFRGKLCSRHTRTW